MFSESENQVQEPEQEPVNVVVELTCPMIWPSTQNETEQAQEPEQATEEKQ